MGSDLVCSKGCFWVYWLEMTKDTIRCSLYLVTFCQLRVWLCLGLSLVFGCNSGAANTKSVGIEKIAAAKQIPQLLQQPGLWQQYSSKERFVMYNNMLRLYHRRSAPNMVTSSPKNKNLELYSEIQRLDDIFLSYLVAQPKDTYNAYYLYNIAGHYIERGEKPMGLWLLRSMYRQFPDLRLSKHPSVHYLILDTLGRMETNLDERIAAIQKILAFDELPYKSESSLASSLANESSDKKMAGRGVWLYRLGSSYEMKAAQLLDNSERHSGNENLQAAMEFYRQFLSLGVASVPEEPNARKIVTGKLNIYRARRNWYTNPDLKNLIRKIQDAIQQNNVRAVLYYQANGFFVLSSGYRDNLERNAINIYLPNFLGKGIQFGSVAPESSNQEAWLYSTNWPFDLSTWYLYFRRIRYPADPEIDGNWEWGGIYLGDFY